MIKLDEKKLKDPEKLQLTQDIRVREHNEAKAVSHKAGDIVTVSGMDKAELAYRGLAVKLSDVKVEEAKKSVK